MKISKSCVSLLLVLTLVLGGPSQAFASYTGTYGFYVPIENSKVTWINNYGSINKGQINSMSEFSLDNKTNGRYDGYFNDVIFVKPGYITLSMSIAKEVDGGYDTTISNANFWSFTSISGSCTVTTSSYKYNTSSMFPGTWYKIEIPGMKSGDLIRINNNYKTGFIFCGSPSEYYKMLQ